MLAVPVQQRDGRGEQPAVGLNQARRDVAQAGDARARRERERPLHPDGVEVGAEHGTARVGPQQDEVDHSGELRSRQLRRHDALAVVAHEHTVAARRDRTRRRIGKLLGEPRRVRAAVAQPVELAARERAGRDHPTDGSADRDHALDRDAPLRDGLGHLDLVGEVAQAVAQLLQRDHLHVAAARALVGRDEVDVGRRHAQGMQHPGLRGHDRRRAPAAAPA